MRFYHNDPGPEPSKVHALEHLKFIALHIDLQKMNVRGTMGLADLGEGHHRHSKVLPQKSVRLVGCDDLRVCAGPASDLAVPQLQLTSFGARSALEVDVPRSLSSKRLGVVREGLDVDATPAAVVK